MKWILIFILIILPGLMVRSQVLRLDEAESDTILYEKLYLHVDREFYAPGDDVWFKSYLVSGINHRLIRGFKNIYAELIAEDGRVIDQRLMLSVNGVANNDFLLPDTLPAGQYTIRAYTKYLKNFGEESLFHQKIAVTRSAGLPETREKTERPAAIDISFLPEGGSFILNAANYIAFKAIDQEGKGISAAGRIVDEAGQEVAVFNTKYKGMGMFVMMPLEGKQYFALLDGYPDFKYPLEDALPEGVGMHYRPEGSILQIILNRNFKSRDIRYLTLIASHKGHELHRETIRMNEFQYAVNLHKELFPHGISRISLVDELNQVLAERLVFIRNSNEQFVRMATAKDNYYPGEKISLEFESLLDSLQDSIVSGLSVAVVNENYFSAGGRMQTIESYMLLDSELKGPLESPASFFADDESVSADEKLDLVMLVNGWRRYYWDELLTQFDKPLPGWDDTGLTIEGEVRTLWGGKPVAGGTVELGPFSRELLILKDTTDEAGRFSFNRLYLKDSALVMVNAFNQKGRQSVEIFQKQPMLFDAFRPMDEINRAAPKIFMHEGQSRSSFYRHLAQREFELEHGSILLGDVEVLEQYKSGPVVTGNFGTRDREFTLTDADREYSNIFKYLHFEVPGIYEYEVDSIRIQNKRPIFYVDDILLEEEYVRYLPLNDIVKVEIYYNPINLISIITKTGFGSFNHEFVRNIHGRITPRIRGFRQARAFYSPKYPLSVEDSMTPPDQRPTMYWEPYAEVRNNKLHLEFYASEMTGTYRVIAEGISYSGKIISGTAVLNVVEPPGSPVSPLPKDSGQ